MENFIFCAVVVKYINGGWCCFPERNQKLVWLSVYMSIHIGQKFTELIGEAHELLKTKIKTGNVSMN